MITRYGHMWLGYNMSRATYSTDQASPSKLACSILSEPAWTTPKGPPEPNMASEDCFDGEAMDNIVQGKKHGVPNENYGDVYHMDDILKATSHT